MRQIKQFTIMLLVISMIFISGCGQEFYKLERGASSIASIEIVYVSRNDTRDLQVTTFCALERKDWNNFLDDLQRLPCWSYWNDPPQSVRDEAIQIRYKDGMVELISTYSSGIFTSDYESLDYNWYYFDAEQFLAFWKQYNSEQE